VLQEYGAEGLLLLAKTLHACSDVCDRVGEVKSQPFTVVVDSDKVCAVTTPLYSLYELDRQSKLVQCSAEQAVDHVVLQCPIHRPHHGLHSLTVLDDETIEWLLNTCPEI